MNFLQTGIPGCYEIEAAIYKDERGTLTKVINPDLLKHKSLNMDIVEQYFSVSHKGVLRGLHFQIPPMDHKKLVYCVLGQVMDVVVDLRVGSPSYGKFFISELSPQKGNAIFIPSGLAHGIYTLAEHSIIVCSSSSAYSPEHDSGIHWNSVGIPWVDGSPKLSLKDQNLIPLKEFISPFSY